MTRQGDLIAGVQRLKRATAQLQLRWAEARETWNDQTARDFEAAHLEPLLPTLRLVLSATSDLDEAYRKAIAACRDQDRAELYE
jgi:hypothetical protein